MVFGTVLSGRLQGSAGADRVVGLLMNTLPMRLTLSGLSVRQAVADARHHLSELVQHETASLALAQRCSAVPAQRPLFSAMINYRHSQARRFTWESCLRGLASLGFGSWAARTIRFRFRSTTRINTYDHRPLSEHG